jgi:hypothetical protein
MVDDTEPHACVAPCTDRVTCAGQWAGEAAQPDLWFPGIRLPLGFVGRRWDGALPRTKSLGARESRAKTPADRGVGLDVDPVEEGPAENTFLMLGASVEALVDVLELVQCLGDL